MQVVAIAAEQRDLDITLHAAGSLEAVRSLDVVARRGGRIETIGVAQGQSVVTGTVLFDIEYAATAAELRRAEAALQLAGTTRERAESLYKAGAVPKQDYDKAAAEYAAAQAAFAQAREVVSDARIVAPFAGQVGAFNLTVGQVVAAGTTLTRLVDSDPLDAVFHISERHAGQVRPGQPVTVRAAAFPGETFGGSVSFVGVEIDPRTRTLAIKAKVANPDGRLRAGMLVDLDLVVATIAGAVVVPEASLLQGPGGTTVFVVAENGTAESRPVVAGTRLPGWVQIVEGVQAGEKVVRDGTQKVQPGVPLQLADPVTIGAR